MPHLRSLSRQDLSILAGLSHDIAFEAIRTLHVRNNFEKSESEIHYQLDLNRLCSFIN